MTAKELSLKCGINPRTISRYENGKFNINNIDIDILQNIAICCGEDKTSLLTPYLLFKLYKKEILESYMSYKNISKQQLSKELGVSYTLVKTWFNKEKRSPSYDVWQTTFKDYSLDWIKHNID